MVIEEQAMTNSDFLSEIYGHLDSGVYGWVASFRESPDGAPPSVWTGRPYRGVPAHAQLIDRAVDDNTYFCTSVLTTTADGELIRRKETFHRLAVLALDDVQLADVANLSYAIQTSPGKHQVGILLDPDDPDCSNAALVDRVMISLSTRGRTNDRSGNGCVRYVRLPRGANTKQRAAGVWRVQLEIWNPSVRWSLDDACQAVGIDLDDLRQEPVQPNNRQAAKGSHAGEMIAGISGPVDQRSYHENLTRLAASLVAGGMFAGAAVEFLYSLMDQVKPETSQLDELRRWQARRAEIPRAVRSAEQFAPSVRQPPSITVNLNAANTAQTQPNDLVPMDWTSLAHSEPEPTAWQLQGWLPERTVTLLAANGGVGKSNLSLQISVALALGKPFMGIETQPSRVLVLSGEDEARTVHFRVANICADQNVPMHALRENLVVYDLTQSDCVLWRNGYPTERMQWLADTAVRSKAQTIVIDNASDVFADNENDRTAVRGFMRALNLIAHTTGAAVLLLAHVDKASVRVGAGLDSNSTFSGSTAWNNSARSRWAMVRDGNAIYLRHEKCNLGALQEPINLEFDVVSKTFKLFGTIPGTIFAAQMLRKAQYNAILDMVAEANEEGSNLSMQPNAPNNIYKKLKTHEQFPLRMDRKTFFSRLQDLIGDGSLAGEEYEGKNRERRERVVVTAKGHEQMEKQA